MKSVSYNIRLDPSVKAEAEQTYAVLGLNLSDAINVFLRKSIMSNGFPFEVTAKKPSKMLLTAIDEAESIVAEATAEGYSTIEEMNEAMDAAGALEAANV